MDRRASKKGRAFYFSIIHRKVVDTHGYTRGYLLLILAPLFVVVGILIKLDSPGPVFLSKREFNLNNKEIIIMVSRLVAWKRVERGIYCVYKLIKEYKFSNIVLLIIGAGSQRKVLEKLVEWLGIKNSVQSLGLIPHREVAKYYSITNLFLSLYDITNLGNPVLEALYFGIPIITISDEGTRQLLEDGYNSLLIKPKNLERDLPVKVKLLLENNSLREKIKKNARLTFEEKVLTWEQRMLLEDRLIKGILKK